MTSRPVRPVVAAATALVALLAGCADGSPVGAGSTVTVPVLWVAVSDSGTTGGVSTASVTADLTGSAGDYSVSVEGAGADTGDSWNAAAAMASAVGVLYSGQDPRGVRTSFAVSDAIDGSSAGGVLAVGVIAAMRGLKVDPEVAMTGTIAPDGSIGRVDGVEAKVRGAAAAGYTTVLIPAASVDPDGTGPQTTSSASVQPSASADETSDQVPDAEALASELGITVTPISTVDQAVDAFTGALVAPESAGAPAMSDAAAAAMSGQASRILDVLSRRLAAESRGLPGTLRQRVSTDLGRARVLEGRGDTAGSYALGVGSLLILDEAAAARLARSDIAADGVKTTAAGITDQADAVVARAERALRIQAAEPPGTDPVGRFAAINAMTWLTRSIAVLRASTAELAATDGAVRSQVVEMARILAQYRLAVNRIYPDSMQIAELAQADPGADQVDVAGFVTAYTALLASAGAANQAYYEGVLTTIAANPDLTFVQPGHTYATVQQLQKVVTPDTTKAATHSASVRGHTPSPEPASATAAAAGFPDGDCAWAMSYFLMSSALVVNDQDFALSGSTIGDLAITAGKPAAVRAAVAAGTDTVDAFAAHLAMEGVDVDHPLWSRGWGAALPEVFRAQPQLTAAQVIGVSLLWDASVETFMNTAALNASRAGG